ncbi:MAG: hypothetical protein AAGJ09_13290 [Pseudomonadota bacterium]
MKKALLSGLVASFIAFPAYANSCGSAPTTPAHFDPASASKDDILRLKSEFEAYKTANTQFIDCMRKGNTTPRESRMIDETIAAEQSFAKAFNNNAKSWAKNQAQRGR